MRIECETAAQCAGIEQAMLGAIEPLILVSVVAAVGLWSVWQVVIDE